MGIDLCVIVACDVNGGIGKDGSIPWFLPEDLLHFKTITSLAPIGKHNALIMGRKTWESLPCKPLPNRLNIVISSTLYRKTPHDHEEHCMVFPNLHSALEHIRNDSNIYKTFVIGGAKLYEEALEHRDCNKVYVTQLRDVFDCDVSFPIEQLYAKYCLVNEGCLKHFSMGSRLLLYTFNEYMKNKI
jgi:dihydrofolate reductase